MLQATERLPRPCEGGQLRIGLLGGPWFGVEAPLAGGLETLLVDLGRRLARRGHDVTVFAGRGEDGRRLAPGLHWEPIMRRPFEPSPAARADVSMTADRWVREHHAYLDLNVRLRAADFDVLHNHSLHHLPPLFDTATPMLHTLHSPPTPWLESALSLGARPRDRVVSVSAANAGRWGTVAHDVVFNGVDVDHWRPSDGSVGPHLVWTGRVVPEKAPHLAIDAARLAGRKIFLAGPAHDRDYFDHQMIPRLGADAVYLGHLEGRELVDLVAGAAAALVTPMWDEPFGLVVAEALAAGTPVVAFRAGGIPEILDESSGVLVDQGDVAAMAAAVHAAEGLDRNDCRVRAVAHCSLDAMTTAYEEQYRIVLGAPQVLAA